MRIKRGVKDRGEKRESFRIKTRFPLVAWCPTGEKFNAKTVDISPRGLQLEFVDSRDNQAQEGRDIEEIIEQKATLNITLNSPFLSHKQENREFPYRVVRSTRLSNGRLLVGLEIQSEGSGTSSNCDVISPNNYAIPAEFQVIFLNILEQMNLQLPNQQSRVIVLTGVEPGSGASTLSWWLASCLSFNANIKVLYVDGNLRPKISTDPSELTSGLLEVLLEQEDLINTTIEIGHSSLSLLNSGGKDGFLGYEVAESQVEAALKKMRENYQYTIINALPVNSSALTAMLAKHADGSFLIVETGVNDRIVAQDAAERLKQADSKILGVILNKF